MSNHEPRTRPELSDSIDVVAAKLAELNKAIYTAYDELEQAEAEWQPVFDDVAEALREEFSEQGRKSSPAEHTILSAARHRNPKVYGRYRRAKRDVARLEGIAQNRRAELSGLQTELREKGSESSAPDLRGLPQAAKQRMSA